MSNVTDGRNPEWLDGAAQKAAGRAVDDIFGWVDGRLRERRFEEIDSLLESMQIEELPTVVLLAFLTITLPVHDQLINRPAFFRRVKELLIEREGSRTESLLRGLEFPYQLPGHYE